MRGYALKKLVNMPVPISSAICLKKAKKIIPANILIV